MDSPSLTHLVYIKLILTCVRLHCSVVKVFHQRILPPADYQYTRMRFVCQHFSFEIFRRALQLSVQLTSASQRTFSIPECALLVNSFLSKLFSKLCSSPRG